VPILERAHAQAAGVGWIGQKTCLIDPRAGAYFLLGEILTTVDLPPDPPAIDHRGTYTASLDARRCIAYWTVEHRGKIPAESGAQRHGWVFGCDLCQEAWPFNRFAPTDLRQVPVYVRLHDNVCATS